MSHKFVPDFSTWKTWSFGCIFNHRKEAAGWAIARTAACVKSGGIQHEKFKNKKHDDHGHAGCAGLSGHGGGTHPHGGGGPLPKI